jgi:uncharacterized protein with ParB-like and HNH nuclease domain
MKNKEESILAELSEARKDIKTDHLQMSIGELLSLYKDGELKLNPAYQRLFRWSNEDKSRFIESLILGIPVPPIFVSQIEDGTWEIVDGLQRISTVLQLTGDLEDHDPLILSSCKYIPSIEGFTWKTLPAPVVRLVKRSRLSVSIILTENSIQSQYELFQRLNTGGLHLSSQEIRNCLIIMADSTFYESINKHKNNPSFKSAIRQSESKLKEEYGMELILRHLISKHNNIDEVKYNITTTLFSDYIDTEVLVLVDDKTFIIEDEIKLLMIIIKRLNDVTNNHTFLKFNFHKNKFEGAFSVSIFEALLPGIATNWGKIEKLSNLEILDAIKGIQLKEEFKDATRSGIKSLKRSFSLNKLSFDFFGNI